MIIIPFMVKTKILNRFICVALYHSHKIITKQILPTIVFKAVSSSFFTFLSIETLLTYIKIGINL